MSSVKLLVYDLSRGMASSLSQSILGMRIDGIWHTGVLVYGVEYYFGGGIQCQRENYFSQSNGINIARTIDMGTTTKTKNELSAFLLTVNHLYTQHTYDLLNNNCNNFSDAVTMFLLNMHIPNEILDQARIALSTPGGQMLRPMLENMSNAMQGRGGMDPFAMSASATSHEQNLATTMQSTLTAAASIRDSNGGVSTSIIGSHSELKLVDLEEKPLISVDSKMVASLANKLKTIDNLSSEDKATIDKVIEIASVPIDTSNTTATANDAMIQQISSTYTTILNNNPKSHLSVYFITRLHVLHTCFINNQSFQKFLSTYVVKRLIDDDGAGYNTTASLVMCLTVLANICSCDAGIDYLVSSKHVETIIDIGTKYLHHEKAEVRSMAAAIALNMTIQHTKHGSNGGWIIDRSQTQSSQAAVDGDDSMNSYAVQLLCNCLENINSEVDELSLQRRLSVCIRIIRSYGSKSGSAAALVHDIGYTTYLSSIVTTNAHSKAMVSEILYYV